MSSPRTTTRPRRKLTFADWVGLVRHMTERTWAWDGIEGRLTVSDDETAAILGEIFSQALEDEDNFRCQVTEGNLDAMPAVGAVYEVVFGRPRLGIGYLFKDVEEWLRNQDVRRGRLERWYIAKEDWAAGEKTGLLWRSYEAVTRLVRVMEDCATVVDGDGTTLVFLPGERLDLPVIYGEVDLAGLNVDDAQALTDFVSVEDGHTRQRREILGSALRDMVKSLPKQERFAHLLRHVSELKCRFQDGYALFASSFSFEKVRDQVEALRIEYTGKIHKTLSDIQGQLLGIPVSTIIMATQMKEVTAPGAQMWVNIGVMVGAVLFLFLLILAVWNQHQTLTVLEDELKRHEALLRADNAGIADRLQEPFQKLGRRIFSHRIILLGVLAICGVGLMIGFAIFWMLTRAALGY